MAARFDGPRVLAAIAGHPQAFPALKSDVDATARKFLVKQMKAPSLNIKTLSEALSAVGEAGILIGFDELLLKDLVAIARRLDPANPSIAEMTEADLRNHICGLGRGDIEPIVGKKVVARPTAKKPGKTLSKIGEILNSKVHSGLPVEKAQKAPSRSRASKS